MRPRGAAVRGCAGTGLAVSVSCLLPCTQCCRGIGRRTEAWRTARLRQLLPTWRILFAAARYGTQSPHWASGAQGVHRGDGGDVRGAGSLAPPDVAPSLGDAAVHHDRHHDHDRYHRVAGIQSLLLVFRLPDGEDLQDDLAVEERPPRRRYLREMRTLRKARRPFGFFPPGDAKDDQFRNPDCMHCRRCVERCPRHALSLSSLK